MPSKLSQEMDLAEGLLQGAYNMDIGEVNDSEFNVEAAVELVGVRAVHEIWAVNELFRQIPELQDHVREYPEGRLVQVLRLCIERQVASNLDTRDNLVKRYGLDR